MVSGGARPHPHMPGCTSSGPGGAFPPPCLCQGRVWWGGLAQAVSQPSAPHPPIAVRTLLSHPLDAPRCSLYAGHKEQTLSCDGHTEPRAPRNPIAARLAHGGRHPHTPQCPISMWARRPGLVPWARHVLCGRQAGDPQGRGVCGVAEIIRGARPGPEQGLHSVRGGRARVGRPGPKVEAKGLGSSPPVTASGEPVSAPHESAVGSRAQQPPFLNFPSHHLANGNKYT